MDQIQKITEERAKILSELKELMETEPLKKYFELRNKSEELLRKRNKLIEKKRINEFNNCEHLLVITRYDYDSYEGRSEKYYGCIKCGLNHEVLSKNHYIFGTDLLSHEEKIMYNYLKKYYMEGSHIHVFCDMDLACAIYAKIKENHPDIDDETATKYFEIALDNMRDIKVSDSRLESRAKRLSLAPNFNRWNVKDVKH